MAITDREAVRRATESAYQSLAATDASVSSYLVAHGWTEASGRFTKGGTSNATQDVALQTELLA
jgi:hypothetical protein